MRFATSFFNPTLYRKNLSRFWPLWVAWLVLWLFALPLNLYNMCNNWGGDEEGRSPHGTAWQVGGLHDPWDPAFQSRTGRHGQDWNHQGTTVH